MILVITLAIICFLRYLQFHWNRRRLYKLLSKVPGPVDLPFIGAGYLFMKTDALAVLKRFARLFDEYPEFAKMWIGPDLYFLVTKPEFLEIILNSPGARGKPNAFYGHLKALFGNGLVTAPVEIWKRHRKIIAPTLSQKHLNNYVEKVSEQCSVLVESLRRECGKGEIDHSEYLLNCSMDILAETLLGVQMHTQTSNDGYARLMHVAEKGMLKKLWLPLYQSDFIFSLSQSSNDVNQFLAKFKSRCDDAIERKKESFESGVGVEGEEKKHFLDEIVEKYMNQEFSFEELQDEVQTFLMAGSETNATCISFGLTLLGMHQEVQQQLYEEILEVLGSDSSVTVDDLPKLKYTERVVKEVLRLFPVGPYIARSVTEDINLGDLVMPKGSTAFISFLHLHRSETYWKDPLKFDPDRFLPENSVNRHCYTWLPFSAGARNCIGMKFGMNVAKIMVAMVIQKFQVKSTIKSVADIDLTTNVSLQPTEGFRLAFERR